MAFKAMILTLETEMPSPRNSKRAVMILTANEMILFVSKGKEDPSQFSTNGRCNMMIFSQTLTATTPIYYIDLRDHYLRCLEIFKMKMTSNMF